MPRLSAAATQCLQAHLCVLHLSIDYYILSAAGFKVLMHAQVPALV